MNSSRGFPETGAVGPRLRRGRGPVAVVVLALCCAGRGASPATAQAPRGTSFPSRVELGLKLLPPDAAGSTEDRWRQTTGGLFSGAGELVQFLEEGRVGGVAVWVESSDPALNDLPQEPHAREVPAAVETRDPVLAELIAALASGEVPLALGRAVPPALDVVDVLLWQDADGSVQRFPRVTRPGVAGVLWFDPEYARRWLARQGGERWSLPLRLEEPLHAELRAVQAALDVLAFTQGGSATPGSESETVPAGIARHVPGLLQAPETALQDWWRGLCAQGRLLSAWADLLGDHQPDRFFALENEWRGPTAGIASWRAGGPELELDEWLFSESAAGRAPLVEALARAQPPARWLELPPLPEAGSAGPGVLSSEALALLHRWCETRCTAAWWLGQFHAQGTDGARERALALLEQADTFAAQLPDAAPAASLDRAGESARIAALEPLRLERFALGLSLGTTAESILGQVTLVRVDDPRFGNWGRRVGDALGGSALRLADFFRAPPPVPLRLQADVPLRSARTYRLEVAGGAKVSCLVNEQSLLLQPTSAARTLRLHLELAAGRNQVELRLEPPPSLDPVQVRLTPLPRRFEGWHLYPRDAKTVLAPVTKLHHPLALDQELFTIPEVANPVASGPGSVDFPFEPTETQRYDVWVHGLCPQGREGSLELDVDGARRFPFAFTPGGDWQWVRIPSPIRLSQGAHQLRFTLREPGVFLDAVAVLETGPQFPDAPPGSLSLPQFAWKYDVLGQGHRLEIGKAVPVEGAFRLFRPTVSGTFHAYAWLRGRTPLRPGEVCEIEIATHRGTYRFLLPAGSPYEEWIPIGALTGVTGEPMELRTRGGGEAAYLCLVP